MSETLRLAGSRSCTQCAVFGLWLLALGSVGCTSMSQDVDQYYRTMAANYKEAAEKANIDAVTLENESKVLATTGDYSRLKKAQRRLGRLKDWEEKCDYQSKRFEKAAEWTEAHFHLEKPKSLDKPPGAQPLEDPTVLQASGVKGP